MVQMVARNYKIKVPGVIKNHMQGVRVLAVLRMTKIYDKYMNV